MKSVPKHGSAGPAPRLQTRTLVILVLIILVSAWTLLSSIDLIDLDFSFNSENTIDHDKEGQKQEMRDNSSSPGILEPAVSLLDPSTKYLSYLPFAGLTNQFIGLEAAAFAAQQLNRTLILPPIISNSHDEDNTHQRWSRYLDLSRFTHLTGVPVLEWDQVRPLTPAQRQAGRDQALVGTNLGPHAEAPQWAQVAENITCQIVYGYGSPELEINHSGMMFLWHFLIRPIPTPPRAPNPDAPKYDRLKVTGENFRPDDLIVMGDLVDRYKDATDQMLLLSHTFKLRDVGHGTNRFWNDIGRNLHFVPKLMEYSTLRVNEEVQKDRWIEVLPNDDPEEKEDLASPLNSTDSTMKSMIPANNITGATESGEVPNPAMSNITAPLTRIPHIAVHLRRGDIWKKCAEKDKALCLIPLELYVDAVARARTLAANRGLHSRLPVIVTTDTDSEEDIRQIQELGWHRVDHEKYGTAKLWGSFGAAMVDAAILAHADEFVGSARSTMTKIAALRQKAWYNRDVLYPVTTKAEKRRDRMRRRMMVADEEEEEEDVRIVY